MKLNKRFVKTLVYVVLSAGFLFGSYVLAQMPGGGSGIKGIATNVTDTFSAFARLITAGAFLAGLGFAFIAVLQFKAHRDNPTTNPLGKPIVYLFIAVALLFLPYLVKQAGQTVFGTGATAGSISGETDLS